MLDPFASALLILLLGPIIGSFIGVLADRLPRNESVITPPSACRSCGTRLSARDLAPILSFALARGQCRHCGSPLPGWLLYTEIAATGLGIWAVAAGGGPVQIWVVAGVLWLLLALILCDLLWLRLPDPLTGALFVLAICLSLSGLGPDPVSAALGAAIAAGTVLFLRWGYRRLRQREGLGLGDVKLMAGLGALLGPWDIPLLLLIASTTLLAVAFAGHLAGTTRISRTQPLPFGAALAAAGGLLFILLR